LKKVLNQVNVYGFDLVNALKNSARTTSSQKMAELFNGLATTISGGGNLVDFLDKRTETLLFDYKLEREKSTKNAETFMDIYISIVIAAPMIMMLLLILMGVSNINIGITTDVLTILMIAGVFLINLVFIVVLHLKQPTY
jgi:flagellar protein FlaJ